MNNKSSRTFFIYENDRLDEVLDRFDDELDEKSFREQLQFIFNKQYNNYVGYYLFLNKDRPYKIFILPKIIEKRDSPQEKIEQFINYLDIFYQLELDVKHANSVFEIAFDNINSESSSQKDMDTFLYHKYAYLLDQINRFFKSHSHKSTRKINYSSQSIKHKLDVAKNAVSLDKSKIYQQRQEAYIYSEIAKISYGALRIFMNQRVNLIDKVVLREKLQTKVKKLSNLLLQKFKVDRSFTIKLQPLLSVTSYQVFRKNQQSKSLYHTILMLFGIERFFDDEDADIHYDIKGDYLFFRPEKLYEKFVYRSLKKSLVQASIQEQAQQSYTITRTNNQSSKNFEFESKPDFIITQEDNVQVVDAKWKVLNATSFNSLPINPIDILKLERDYFVHEAKEASLIYCKIKDPDCISTYKVLYSNNKDFTFSVKEISLNLK